MADVRNFLRNNIWKIVATLMLGFLLYTADFKKVLEAIRNAKLNLIVLAAIPGLLNVSMWVLAWRKMFSLAGVNYTFREMFRLYTSARFVNLVTPLGHFGGAPIMAIVVSENTDSEYGRAISAILTANILVSFPLFFFAIVGYLYLFFTDALSTQMSQMFFGLLFIIAVGTFFIMLGWISPQKFGKFVRLCIKPIVFFEKRIYSLNIKEKAFKFEDNVLEAFSEMRGNNRTLLYSILIVSLAVFWRIVSLHLVLNAIGIKLSIFVLALLIPLLSLANYGPTPGGSGFVEAALVGLLLLFSDTATSSALAAAILYRLVTYYMEVSLGYISMSTLDSVELEEHIK